MTNLIEMEDWQIRVCEEKNELDGRIQRLTDFIGTPMYNELAPQDRALLLAQREAMIEYSVTLGNRIARFT